ncbi:MAG: hypothetical protein SNH79_06125 [Rikenellaceae bacterium]
MKKIITSLALTLSVIALAHSQECNKGTTSACTKPSADAKLISKVTEGDKTTCKWLVKETTPDESNEFIVKYRVNAAQISDSYAQNDKTLTGASKFMSELMNDTLKHIERIYIIGHASPDGSVETNAKLARKRASNFCSYVTKKFDLGKYSCTPTSEAYSWGDIKDAVEASKVPQKSAVVSAITSGKEDYVIEAELRKMPSSWYYLTKNVLPEFRCVDLHVVYTSWKEIETCSTDEPECVEEINLTNYYIVVEEPTSDIIVVENMHAPAIDFKDCKTKHCRKDGKYKYKYEDNKRRDKLKEEERTFWGRKKSVIKAKKERKAAKRNKKGKK